MRELGGLARHLTPRRTAFGQDAPASREQEFFTAAERGDAAVVKKLIAGGLAVDGRMSAGLLR